jgi:hypothetical protein
MIKNGKNTPLNQNSGTVPNMGDTLLSWFQQMKFTRLAKTVVNFEEKAVETDYVAQGVIQPMSAQQLSMKPEGQTSWKWWTIHADPSLILLPGELVKYLDTSYKVMGKSDYSLYGYLMYEVVELASMT